MKILYVTPDEPSLWHGGGRHCYANARALSLYPGAIVDYVGPEIQTGLPDLPSETFRYRVARPFTLLDRVNAALCGASTSLVSLFNGFVRKHPSERYDLVFVESTRCAFAFRAGMVFGRTICCVHCSNYI